ncbi:hypothetical protein [Prauserella muralis]|uniref:Uncharacterized protein n=1 Tax=Prauserella muralis TaxID=588067 RepID=A0A2V4ALJ8_9PSEU|nr:hypothetical protein [Prauserella muralis]PXY20844.1 hypothetical protein BAY60_25405 [Prauserella muralis]TWE29881.1 hypothetical protein FHX69_2573 [Prauserella muralis]
MNAYRVNGTTADVTECELCGRVELKGTVVLEALDVEGIGTGEVVYFGAQCAARAAGWTVREVRKAAKSADDLRRREFAARFRAWARDTLALDVTRPYALADYRHATGKTLGDLKAEFADASGLLPV